MTESTPSLMSQWLAQLRLRRVFVVVGELARGESVSLPAERGPALHYVTRGGCTVTIDGEELELDEGDLLLMRQGRDRRVSIAGAIERPAKGVLGGVHLVPGRLHRFRLGDDADASVVLGIAACPLLPSPIALDALPPVVVLRRAELEARLRAQLEHLVEEAESEDPSAPEIATRIAEVVMLVAARAALCHEGTRTPLLHATRDARLGRALRALHEDLASDWTVTSLARVAGMSRSGFSDAFTNVLEVSPGHYVTRERMRAARAMLCDDASVQETADAVGYASVAAFSVAFKRTHGHPPSRAKQEWERGGAEAPGVTA